MGALSAYKATNVSTKYLSTGQSQDLLGIQIFVLAAHMLYFRFIAQSIHESTTDIYSRNAWLWNSTDPSENRKGSLNSRIYIRRFMLEHAWPGSTVQFIQRYTTAGHNRLSWAPKLLTQPTERFFRLQRQRQQSSPGRYIIVRLYNFEGCHPPLNMSVDRDRHVGRYVKSCAPRTYLDCSN